MQQITGMLDVVAFVYNQGSGASRDSGRLSPIWCRNVADTPDAKTLHFQSFHDEAKTED